MTPDTTPASPRARYPGLDGLRALAVALVIVYHVFPQLPVRGGFVGVDVFFVISGFLITSLLLRERARTGRIRLTGFWQRRARRLLPALAVLLTVCSTAAWFVGGDVLVGLGRQLLGAATFSSNWLLIAGGADYFQSGQPELFRNLWSLAVEEQFYVLWPLLLPLLLLIPGRWARAAVALVAAAGSAVWMAALVAAASGPAASGSGAADVTRAYFGTGTHAFGILLGVALAFVLPAVTDLPRPWMLRRGARIGATATGAAALAVLLAIAALPETPTALTFPGALAGAALATAVVIAAAVWPGTRLGAVLDAQPLRWAGERSYALYLWHWPLLVLLAGGAATVTWPAGLAVLGLTVAASELSYRWVETPVRRHGFRGCAAGLGRALTGSARGRTAALAGLAASALVVGGTSAAVAAAPTLSSGEAAVAAGAAALRDQAAAPAPASPAPPSSPGAPAPASADPAGAAPVAVPPVTGDQVTAIGDSVMLASAPGLLERFPGIEVDAAVSRSMYAAPGILRALADAGRLRPYVVLALGTNGPIEADTLSEIVGVIGPDRQLVLVTASAPRSWIPGVNDEIAAFARTHRDVLVADWAAAIAPHRELLAGDEIHPGEAAGRIFADTVGQALTQAQEARARELEFAARRAGELQLRAETLVAAPGAPTAQ